MIKVFLEDPSGKNLALKNIYLFIRQYGPISKAELLEKTKLNQSTLARIINKLLKNKLIRESGIKELSAAGRPPVLYHIEAKCGYIIGVIITRLKTEIVLFDLLFHPIEQKSFVMTSMHNPYIVISNITQTIQDFMNKHDITIDKIIGIGIGTIGPLNKEKGLIVGPQPILAPGWVNIPIVEMLKETLPVKILLENASNLSVLGEYRFTPEFSDVLYCFSGWRMGFGVITKGELIPSKKGDRSNYGHMIIDVNGRKCACGKRGCLESYTSPYAILEELAKRNPSNDWTTENWRNMQIDDVINFLKQEKHFTEEVVMESAYYFGVGLANIINVLQSDLVILNGPLIFKYPNYYETVVEFTLKHLDEKENVKFSQGILKEKSATIGSATLIFDSYF